VVGPADGRVTGRSKGGASSEDEFPVEATLGDVQASPIKQAPKNK
jgi:hypothetical protein